VSFPSQSTPLGIREANAMLTQTLFEESVLLLEILDDLELLTVDPPRQHQKKELKEKW
jgi:hypothetical protein